MELTKWQKQRQKLSGALTATLALLATKYPQVIWLTLLSGLGTIWFDVLDDILFGVNDATEEKKG